MQSRWQSKSYRQVVGASFAALWWSAACGSNPELVIKEHPFKGPGALGAACVTSSDCQESLLCGKDSTCIGACGDTTSSKTCGPEACLPSGRCSEGLGRDCTGDADCSAGLACSEMGHCAVPCQANAPGFCRDGAVCRSSGTCPTEADLVIGVGGASNGGDGDNAGGSHDCIDVKVEYTPQIPSVVLLIDRSGSMNAENFGAAVKEAVDSGTYTLGNCPEITVNSRQVNPNDWRWNVVRDVLMNPDKGIVKPLEDRVRFGLSLYSSDNGQIKPGRPTDPIEIDPTKMCPVLIDVPIALNNHQSMLDHFQCSDIAQDTPTGESLQAAADRLKGFQEPGPKLIVLATDGEPDNCECPNFNDNAHVPAKCKEPGMAATVKDQVVGIAKQIHDEDITVHVINVSTPGEAALQQHLKDLADAGGGSVYPGFSPGDLSKAFEDIIDGARSCKIDLNGEIATGKEKTGTVSLDGDPLELDDTDGWQVNSPTQIELLGSACEKIKRGDHDLSIRFPCESFKPVVH